MPVSFNGQLNPSALIVPGVYVNVLLPQQNLNGLPTNIGGIVGTGSWGPVNSPVAAGSPAQAAAIFGPMQPRKYDLVTAVQAAAFQGASNFRLVRVTDGTDAAATIEILTDCLAVSSKYTGSLGNQITFTLSAGSKANSVKAQVSMPGLIPEVFDNIGAGLAGNALWIAIATAINNGVSSVRGPSAIVKATAGAGATAPALTTYTLGGGTDGASGVTGATLVGQDNSPRSGMYALRRTGTSVAMLADCDDSTTWSTQVAYGLSEGAYMVATGPAGDNIANAIATKATAGIDSFAMKLLFGDWCLFQDTTNKQTRLISPQGFILGMLANLGPQESSLNKPLQGIVGTQESAASLIYSDAELQLLGQAGIDVIANPSPGGEYFAARFGHNTSSDQVIQGDNYTRMTNYLAFTIVKGMGKFIGEVQSGTERQDALATLGAYFDNLQSQGLIGDPNGAPAYSIKLDGSNNPQAQVSLGIEQADVQVEYLGIVEKLLINLQGGASVQITRQTQLAA